MLTLAELSKALRRAKTTWGPVEVSPELRGWSYDKPPVKPPAYPGLALSDFAYGYCPTYRNIYLKYVLGERGGPSKTLQEGQVLHSVLFKALEDFRRYAYAGVPMSPGLEGVPEDLRDKAEALYKYVAARLIGEYSYALAARLARSRDAAVFYATLVWAMFDRGRDGTLPRLTTQNLADADKKVTETLSTIEGLADKPPHDRVAPPLVATQPHIYAKLAELLAEDVKEAAMTIDMGRYDIGVIANSDGTYELTADWWGVETTKGVSQEEFEQQLGQRYQYHNVKEACEAKGYAVEEELNEEDGSIRLVVRKWVSE